MRDKIGMLMMFCLVWAGVVIGQEPNGEGDLSGDLEPPLQWDMELTEDAEQWTEDMLLRLSAFRRHPVDLNDEEALAALPLISSSMARSLIDYRKRLGNLVSVYELQAVPGFDEPTVRMLIPFVTVLAGAERPPIAEMLQLADQQLMLRWGMTAPRAKGFIPRQTGEREYDAQRSRLLFRYQLQCGKWLRMGWLAEQDPGEPFRGTLGFDHYSGWLSWRPSKKIALFLGDFTVRFGQGLIMWQGAASFGFSAISGITRTGEAVRVHSGSGESGFFRGIAGSLRLGRAELLVFTSRQKASASVAYDSLQETVITAFRNSGLHRSATEREGRRIAPLMHLGGRLQWNRSGAVWELQTVRLQTELPLLPRNEPFRYYAVRGKAWQNSSFSFRKETGPLQFAGELALDSRGKAAALGSLIASLDEKLDIALLWRDFHRGYQAPLGQAFGESTSPSNEQGWYGALEVHPSLSWTITAGADYFRHPRIRYQVDAPSSGIRVYGWCSWKGPGKTAVSARVTLVRKPRNGTDQGAMFRYPVSHMSSGWRLHLDYPINQLLAIRVRMELSRYRQEENFRPPTGSLFYADMQYKGGPRFSGGFRIQWFDTEDYNTRIYAFEYDFPFAASVPAFFDRGFRVLGQARTRWKFRAPGKVELQLALKYACTWYLHRTSIGSGQDEIPGNRKEEWKVQFILHHSPTRSPVGAPLPSRAKGHSH